MLPGFLLTLEGAEEEWGWVEEDICRKEVTFAHIWLSYKVSLALRWIELPCVSHPPLF